MEMGQIPDPGRVSVPPVATDDRLGALRAVAGVDRRPVDHHAVAVPPGRVAAPGHDPRRTGHAMTGLDMTLLDRSSVPGPDTARARPTTDRSVPRAAGRPTSGRSDPDSQTSGPSDLDSPNVASGRTTAGRGEAGRHPGRRTLVARALPVRTVHGATGRPRIDARDPTGRVGHPGAPARRPDRVHPPERARLVPATAPAHLVVAIAAVAPPVPTAGHPHHSAARRFGPRMRRLRCRRPTRSVPTRS